MAENPNKSDDLKRHDAEGAERNGEKRKQRSVTLRGHPQGLVLTFYSSSATDKGPAHVESQHELVDGIPQQLDAEAVDKWCEQNNDNPLRALLDIGPAL